MKQIISPYNSTKITLHDNNSIELYFHTDQLLFCKDFHCRNRFPNPKETFQLLSDRIELVEDHLIMNPIEEEILFPDMFLVDFLNVVQMKHPVGTWYGNGKGTNFQALRFRVGGAVVVNDGDFLENNKYMLLESLLDIGVKILYEFEVRRINTYDITFYYINVRGHKEIK
jgi:hypothetical protein